MDARGFTFSLNLWLQTAGSLGVAESLSPRNKVLGKSFPFFCKHIPTLIFLSRSYSLSSSSPRRSIDFVPAQVSPKPVSWVNPHKKYNIFLSFDPTTAFLPLPTYSWFLRVCSPLCVPGGSVSLIRRGSPGKSASQPLALADLIALSSETLIWITNLLLGSPSFSFLHLSLDLVLLADCVPV